MHSASPPFTAHSPAPRRLPLPAAPSTLPTSSSDGALLTTSRAPITILPLLPAQPKRIKPFILRSTSPPSKPTPPLTAQPTPTSPKKSKVPTLPRRKSAPVLTVPIPPPRVRKSRKSRDEPSRSGAKEHKPVRGLGDMTNGRSALETPTRKASGYAAVGLGTAKVPMGPQQSYSSLQEMLESSGFTDTRVITPTAVRRAPSPSPNSFPPPALARSLKPKPSLLSLGGFLSVFSTRTERGDAEDDDAGSDGTVRERGDAGERNERAREWAERVAREAEREPLVVRGTTIDSDDDDGDTTPTARTPITTSTSPIAAKKDSWAHSLRHVVSDPSLSLSFGGSKEYVSFADVVFAPSPADALDIPCASSPSRVEYDSTPSSPVHVRTPSSRAFPAIRNWPSLASIGSSFRSAPTPADAKPKLDRGPTLLRKSSKVFQPAAVAAPVLTTESVGHWDWDKGAPTS